MALRKLLEVAVATTSTSLTDAHHASTGVSQELEGRPGADTIHQATSLRVALAEPLLPTCPAHQRG